MPHPAINIKNHWVTRAVRESPINEKYYKTVERSSSKVYNFCKPISSNHPHHAAVHNITHQCLAEIMDKDGKPYKPRRTCYRFFISRRHQLAGFVHHSSPPTWIWSIVISGQRVKNRRSRTMQLQGQLLSLVHWSGSFRRWHQVPKSFHRGGAYKCFTSRLSLIFILVGNSRWEQQNILYGVQWW